jgi:hypothetical protein
MLHLGDPQVRQRVLQRLAVLQPAAPAVWGKMTAPQMLCHLTDSFDVSMGRKTASSAGTVFHRTLMKWGALYLPMKWPQGVPTRPEVEQGSGGTRPQDFDADRALLVAAIDRFCDPNRTFPWHPHPIFGPMTDTQWLRWGYLHTDHHFRQFAV